MPLTRFVGAAFCLFLGLASTASAGPIVFNSIDSDDEAWFYNKPGITLAQLDQDFSDCQSFGQAMQSGDGAAYTGHGIAGALIVAANSAAPIRAFADNCMIARGYRRFRPAEHNQHAFLRRYQTLDEAHRLALASEETPPEGTISRAWDNGYLVDAATHAQQPLPRPPLDMRIRDRTYFPVENLEQAALSAPISLGPDQALLIMTLRSGSADAPRGGVIEFSRHVRETGMPSPFATRPGGHRMRLPVAQAALAGADVGDEQHVFAWIVPAGYYALSGIWSVGGFRTSMCMGTPAFNAEPGAVLYLGDYAITRGGANMPIIFGMPGANVSFAAGNLDEARVRLSASPDLAGRLALADYQNGFVRACPWEAIFAQYGLDLPGMAWLEENTAGAATP